MSRGFAWSTELALRQLQPVVRLPAELQRLAAAAVAAQRHAYCPYSSFGVGAALLHPPSAAAPSQLDITVGCNYENCTLQSCCAERCAIVKANVEGRRTALAVAVYGRAVGGAEADGGRTCPPCGLCRQLLVEVADLSDNFDSFQVVLVAADAQQALVVPLADLLPMKFGPADVGMDLGPLRGAPA
ncbi:cytidine deaminase [Strigomonas culicis]|uniref:Cytidine deaminase n=1 Tax=Strigomonas culicis TaxID=28005 RepID=S9VPP3_9TRYP|nr:cytidine deaminase [Strigomonas culicis]|eukprot:EPY29026.1 cytidine deaminase [Strigomonas culicis]